MKGTYNRGVPDTFRATGVRAVENDQQERCRRLEKEKQKTWGKCSLYIFFSLIHNAMQ